MPKIIAIHGGDDWFDASANYVILPEGMDIQHEYEKYQDWYKNEYSLSRKLKYMTFTEWLIKAGARETNNDELEIFSEF